jgi:anti-sigma B factor antagonist
MTHVTQEADRTILTPATDIVASNAKELRTMLFELIQSGQKHVVIDLQHVAMVDSSGLGVFIATQNTLKTQGGDLTVTNVSADLQRLFQLMRLDQHFTVAAQ